MAQSQRVKDFNVDRNQKMKIPMNRLYKIVSVRKTAIFSQFGIISLFLILTLIAFRKIIPSPGVIGMESEWNIPPFSGQFKQLFEEDLYLWGDTMGSFGMEHNSVGLYYKLFLYFLSLLGMDGGAISKFVSVFVMTLAGYSMFYLCRRISIGILPSAIAGVFYMMNPEVFNRFGVGHIGILLTYAILPLTLAFFFKYIEGNHGFKTLMLAGLFLALASMDIRNYFIILFALLFFSLIHGVYRRSKHSLLNGLKGVVIVLFVSFIIQSYWTIPLAIDMTRGLGGQVASAVLGGDTPIRFISSKGYELDDVMRLAGTHLPYWELAVKGSYIWRIFGFLPAILAFSALLLTPKDRKTVFFSMLAVIGILLVSAGKGPLNFLWLQLLEASPILWIFRSPIVFYPLISLGFAVLIGLSAEALEQRFNKIKKYSIQIIHYGKASVTFALSPSKAKVNSLLLMLLIFLGILFAYAHPFFTGDFGGKMQTYEFSKKYEQLWQRISSDPEDFRVLTLPAPYPTLYSDAKYSPTPGYDMMSRYLGKDFLYYGKLYSPRLETFLIKTLYENRTEHLADLLSLSNIKYIIFDLNKSTTATDHGWAVNFPEMRFTNEKLIRTLQQQKHIEQLDVMDSILIFSNERYLDHIFPVGQVELFAGDLDGLVSLSYTENLDLKTLGLVFVNQLSKEDFITLSNLPNVEVIIQDGHFLDLVLTAASREYVLSPVQYALETSPDEGWTLMKWMWYRWHYQAPLERLAFTFVHSNLDIPYLAKQNGTHEIYLKLYFGPDASSINLYIDDSKIGEVITKKPSDVGFRWAYLGSVYLNQGDHDLRIESADGENAIASVAIVPKEAMDEAQRIVVEMMRDKRTIILSELDWSEWDEKEETPLFTPLWDDDEVSPWTVAYGGSGTLGVPTVTIENTITKQGNSFFKFTVPSGGNYGYAAIDQMYSSPEDWSNYDALFLWWYGENTGTKFAVRLEDSTGGAQEWRPVEDWTGWKRLAFPLREPEVYWETPANLSDIVKTRIAKYEAGEWYLDRGGIDVLSAQTGFIDVGVNASEGFALSTAFTPIKLSMSIPKQGFYTIYLRAVSDTLQSNVTLWVNSFESKIQVNSLSNGFQWYSVGETYLSEGSANISLFSEGGKRTYFDQLLIMEPSNSSMESASVKLTSQRINPTKHLIYAESSQPFYIFFSERYHNSWKIYLEDGTQIQSYPAYSFGNLFFINKTRNLKMTLEFEKQQLYDAGKYVSFTSLIVLVSLLLLPTRSFRFFIREKRTSQT